MAMMKAGLCWQFVLAKADGSDYQSIVDSDSMYMRTLKFYYEANQLGLVDPESPSQNYDSLFLKYQQGDIFFCVWPWLSQSAYNTLSNKEAGRGFMLAPIDDMQIYSYGCRPMGNDKEIICIGSNAKDPERLADFIDWLYSEEGVFNNSAQVAGGTAGPEGLTWERTENGPVLTDFGMQALMNGDVELPEEWGGGVWSAGISVERRYFRIELQAHCAVRSDEGRLPLCLSALGLCNSHGKYGVGRKLEDAYGS